MVENIYNKHAGHLIIKINGRFDFNCHKLFRDAFLMAPGAKTYEVNLLDVNYLDSSALGMLLLLRDHVDTKPVTVSIDRNSTLVASVLKMANFHRIFTIHE